MSNDNWLLEIRVPQDEWSGLTLHWVSLYDAYISTPNNIIISSYKEIIIVINPRKIAAITYNQKQYLKLKVRFIHST